MRSAPFLRRALVLPPIVAALVVACGGTSADIPPSPVDASADGTIPIEAGGGDGGDAGVLPDGSPADSGSDAAPGACTYGVAGACAADEYCDAPTCGKGTCTKMPAEKSDLDPVCGCDEITYWNATVAARAGIAAKAAGRCGATAKGCGGVAGQQCPKGSSCGYELDAVGQCGILDPRGKCWGLPSKCPTILIGPVTRGCGDVKCTGACELIGAQKPFYKDTTCPQ